MLTGTEVKSLREGKAQLKDAYATIGEGGGVADRALHPALRRPRSRANHEPERERKLLLHRAEIERADRAGSREQRLTLVPTRIYFSGARSRAKVEIALARGKDLFDKRDSIRDARDGAGHASANCASARALSLAGWY